MTSLICWHDAAVLTVYFRCSSLGASVYNSVDSLTMKDLEFTISECQKKTFLVLVSGKPGNNTGLKLLQAILNLTVDNCVYGK